MAKQTLAGRFADYATQLSFEKLTPEAIHEVKRRVIDSIGCAMGAWDSEPATFARAHAGTATSAAPSTVVGTRHRSTPELAAFANGVMFRYLDYNDTYLSKEPAHPSDNLAAVLAIAEVAGSSGKDIINAAVLAYEIQCRLCDACSIRARGWDHVTYGSFSTSVACGKLLGLSAEQLVHAQGLAGVPNNAMRQTRVGMLSHWKGCAFANASRNGVFAAQLAKLGMTGASEVFEGEMGFFKEVSGPFEVAPMGGDGRSYMINDTYIKFWPAEYHSQSAIDAALQLRPEIGGVDNIESILVESFNAAVEIIGGEPEKWRPTTRETADHSLPYCVAAALTDGNVTLDSFDDARLKDEKLLALVQKIKVQADAELNKRYPEGIPNRITVTTKDGAKHAKEVIFPRGHARNPMTDSEVESKFRSMADVRLGADRAGKVLEQCWQLDRLKDLAPLMELVVVGK
ncbi:MAG: MmgE/PrpD family protein [Candidatus Sumerlaeaceae bacterium]|nr:MmgE/PrpD family protein [Candidatus Sumerlaeaceae bacterium]